MQSGLTPVADAIRRGGYETVEVAGDAGAPPPGIDALVVSGQADGAFGDRRMGAPIPVVNADGRTPDGVVKALDAVLGPRAAGPA